MYKKKVNKQKANNTNTIKLTFNRNKIDILLLTLFSIGISVLLFLRGGYFERDMLWNLILIYVIFGMFIFIKVRKEDIKIFESPVDILLFGIAIMYLLSIFYGVNKRASLIEFSKHIAFFAVYIMARYFSKNKKYRYIILNVIIAVGVIVSVIGIGAGISTWEVAGGATGGRISSTLQYPNTLAVYVSALYLLVVTMIIVLESRVLKGIYGFALGTFLFTLIATYSRAMWLMFPIAVLLYLIIIPGTRKLEAIIYMIVSAIISIPAAFLYMASINEPSSKLWIYYVAAFVGSGILVYLVSILSETYRAMSIKRLTISLTVVSLVAMGLVVYAVNQTEEVTLENNTSEVKTTSITRNISDVYTNISYNLRLKYDGNNESGEAFIGSIVIDYLDEKGVIKGLVNENITEISGEKIINFTTPEDFTSIIVHFQNSRPKTGITIYTAELVEIETGNVVSKIPLNYKYIPEVIVRRANSIGLSESSASARIRFNIDGLRIVKNYPILGAGGGGWVSLYQKYQSYPYWTTLAHNYFLQLWIEIGTVGLLLLVAFLITSSMYAFKEYKSLESITQKTYIAGLYAVLFTMLMHAFVDFDMSLSGYAIVFWGLMGILLGKIHDESININKLRNKLKILNTRPSNYILIFICIVLILNSYSILSTTKYLDKGAEANEAQDIDGLIENYEKASNRDRFKSTIKIDLSNAYKQRFNMYGNTEDLKKAYQLTEDYLNLSPTDGLTQSYGSEFYFSIGEIEKGIALADEALELNPMRIESYLQKLDAYMLVSRYLLENGDKEGAKAFLYQGLTIKEEMKVVNEKAFKPLWESSDLVKRIGEAEFMLKNIDNLDEIKEEYGDLIFAYYFDVDMDGNGQLDMLRTFSPDGSLINHEQLADESERYIRISNEGQVPGFKYVYPISHEPDTRYIVQLKARGTTKPETFNLYIWSNGAEDPNQGQLSAELTDDWQTYSFEFITDSDIETGIQYIRIQHNGNDEGYIDIMDLVIFKR